MCLDIMIKDKEDAEKLNKEASKVNEILFVHSNDGMIMVDARSLLGLCALVGVPCRLVAEDCVDPDVLFKVKKKAGV